MFNPGKWKFGNNTVSQDGAADDIDQPIAAETQTKPSPRPNDAVAAQAGGDISEIVGEAKNSETVADQTDKKAISKEKAAAAQSINAGHGDHQKRSYDDHESEGSIGSESDVEPVDVLLQFIPYYGQGDPANDSIVRSTLSGLSVEDIDSQDEYGNTLLLLACQYRCEDLVRIMINKGADSNAVNSSGACCLHFACYRESASINVARILLKSGANPDVAESTFGCTPLHYCAGTGDTELCKLLLSYGANISALDYYNYTCVDYASEAGMTEVASFLQQKLDQENGVGRQFGSPSRASSKMGMLGGSPPKPAGAAANDGVSNADISNWESHVDPDSGGKYYIHIKTGECLWENELKQRIAQYQMQAKEEMRSSFSSSAKISSFINSPEPAATAAPAAPKISEAELIKQATQARLIVFFTTHDPPRLVEVDDLLKQHQGQEHELLEQLCAKYNVEGGPELEAFQAKIKELRPTGPTGDVTKRNSMTGIGMGGVAYNAASGELISSIDMIDPLLLQELSRDERVRFETRLSEEKAALKKRYDTQMEEEKAVFIQSISEKEGLIAKLTAEIESLDRGKSDTMEDIEAMKNRMQSLQADGGEQLNKLREELEAKSKECQELKEQLTALQQQLNYEKEKLTSLEVTMANLESGNEDRIAQEKAAAEERAAQQREREEQHSAHVKKLEEQSKIASLKLKQELNDAKNDFIRKEEEAKDQHDQIKKAKDREIDGLRRELMELKSQYAQELSSANLQLQDLQKTLEDAEERAEEAEAYQKSVQQELAEAKIVQKYNAQLHKDLQREQLARKKLHNDMEDMKGKIRVYVRIRPFSKSEMEKNCTESVTRDGKMTVLLTGLGGQPDAKKYYDFDQVFGGMEGNSQTDVFKDTKHLIMSVVDGYNVCIFAYGQTGAGKSFTMIGAADIGTCMSENGDFDELAGITPRAVSELFRLLNERTAQVDFQVEVQMFQLYRDGLDDLLADPVKKKKGDDADDKKNKPPTLKITLAEHSPTGLVHVDGAVSMEATTPGEVMKIFAKGSSRRATASTQMNAESSRSHLICVLVVKLKNKRTGKESVGKLTLVDLAGSERVDKSGASGDQLKEAQSINKSLSALGDVIASLTSNQQHTPYRNHPLTMLMSDSIGGNAKTLMFVNTSPADYNTPESNNSLAFANRCKDITNNVASAAPGVQAAQMNALKKELAKMKKSKGGAAPGPPGGAMLARPDTATMTGGGGGRRPR